MITEIALGNTPLSNSKRFCTAIGNLGFPSISYAVRDKGGFLGKKITLPQSRSFKFSTEWAIVGESFSDLASQREEFVRLLGNILSEGVQTLKITKDNDVSVQIDVKAVNVVGNLKAEDKTLTPFLVEFEAEYPFLQSSDEIINEVNIFSGGGMAIPMEIPMDMSADGSSETFLVNSGNYKAYPLITFYGIMTNPTLTNSTTGESIDLTYNLATADDFIVVDTFLHTVTLYPSGNSVRGKFTGDFLTLAAGNNYLKLSVTSGTTGKCFIRYRNHYLGI